jgi:hypothetical protein
MANPTEASGANAKAATGKNNLVHTAVLVLTILLCSASCALMLMLDPRSLAVDSVYQGF